MMNYVSPVSRRVASVKCKLRHMSGFMASGYFPVPAFYLCVAGTMASRADKEREVAVASKGFKRLRKGVALSSLAQKVPPSRRFGAKAVEEHGLKWFNAQKEAKYDPEN
ncbi:hypothetical protein HAX54_036355 [Datura stramonium]|uniref:Uncharacterized protein n=1 Tax=Datura stramonium TaxID=4076 RepID=A0ABS8VI01_DATST|nr:hypothetical protein [Datura stramonium]